MSTHSTVPLVKKQLVDKMKAALATASARGGQVQTGYAWPGPATEPECVFLGRHPDMEESVVEVTTVDPTLKAGRRQRQESYDLTVTVWSFLKGKTPDTAAEAEARAFAIADLVDDMLADDALIGLEATQIQHALLTGRTSSLHPFDSGWACDLRLTVSVAARLL